MQKHAGQVRALKNGANLTTQQSRSWTDYVRPLLPKDTASYPAARGAGIVN